jgi:hypothetical protein
MGYVSVPKGCSVTFYTHFAKLLNATMVVQILGGSYAGEPDRQIGEFKSVPNVRMSSLTQGQVDNANKWYSGAGAVLHMLPAAPPVVRKTLQELMDECIQSIDTSIDFHWLCCQSLTLTQKGGRALGLNASDRTAQSGHEGYYLFKWKEGGVDKEKWVKSNSSIHR